MLPFCESFWLKLAIQHFHMIPVGIIYTRATLFTPFNVSNLRKYPLNSETTINLH